jgi:hypothetical protein
MNRNDPYAKLGGGALDQELFKSKQTPPSSHISDTSDKKVKRSKAQLTPHSRQEGENKASKSIITHVKKAKTKRLTFPYRDFSRYGG